jgi:hypothetical protein
MRFPLSDPPKKPTSWWKSIPGQLAILVMIGALIWIILGATGVISTY